MHNALVRPIMVFVYYILCIFEKFVFGLEHLHPCISTRGHLHHGIPTRGHSHHDIPIRGHLHPEDFCISISTRRHLHHAINMRTSIIMNKPCIFIPTQDICIMKITFASLLRSICIKNKIRTCITFCLHS